MRARHVLLVLLVVLIWGVNFTVIDLGLGDVPPLVFLALRFALVAVPAVFVLPRPRLPWREVLAIGGLLSFGQFAFLYLAISLGMPAGLASLVAQAQVVITLIISTLALRERPSRQQLVGAAVGIGGLALVAVGHGGSAPLGPLLVTLLAALCWGAGNVVSRRAATRAAARDPELRSGAREALSLVAWSALVVPLPALALALLVDGPDRVIGALASLQPATILSTLYTVILASLVGYGVWNAMLARYAAPFVAPFTLLVPAVGIATAWLVLGETPSALELLGGAVMITGLAIAVIRRPSARPQGGADPTPPPTLEAGDAPAARDLPSGA